MRKLFISSYESDIYFGVDSGHNCYVVNLSRLLVCKLYTLLVHLSREVSTHSI
jgi:hypothetical protein